MNVFEYLNDKAVLQKEPVLFTGILEEAIADYFTLYLLEGDGLFHVFAPSFIGYNFPSDSTTHYKYLAENLVRTFDNEVDARTCYQQILEHIGEPLDLRSLQGGFMLTEFDMDADLYEIKPKMMPKIIKPVVSAGKNQHILFHVVNVGGQVIINKRMCLTYEEPTKAFNTYVTITKHFLNVGEIKLPLSETEEAEVDLDKYLPALASKYMDLATGLELQKSSEGEVIHFSAMFEADTLRLRVHYSFDTDLRNRPVADVKVILKDMSTKISYVNYLSDDMANLFAEQLVKAVEMFEEKLRVING